MTNWRTVPFHKATKDRTAGTTRVPRSAYLPNGSLAVVDQGQDLIGGFIDSTQEAYSGNLPVIIFGDHTRIFKYIDFPFTLGAEGVRILEAGPEFEPRFLYHYFRSCHIPNRGYSRHFKFLKEIEIPQPPISEQQRISRVLDQVDDLRVKRRQAITLLDELSKSVFLDMFGDPIQNPHGYPVHSMIDWVDANRPITYGILKPGPDQPAGIDYVRVVDMKNGGIDTAQIKKTTPEISWQHRRSRLKSGDVLLSIRGHVGRLAEVPPKLDGANITQDTARLAVPAESARFIISCLRTTSFQYWMARNTKGAAVKGINLADVKSMPVPRPPIELQRTFSQISAALESQMALHRSQLSELDTIFGSLQQRAFRREL